MAVSHDVHAVVCRKEPSQSLEKLFINVFLTLTLSKQYSLLIVRSI